MKAMIIILGLLMMTTQAMASGAVLWRVVHTSTNLIKDENWLLSVTTLDYIEDTDIDLPVGDMDALIVEDWSEWTEWSDTPEVVTEAPVVEETVEDMVSTPDEVATLDEEIPSPDEQVNETGE